MPLILSSFLFSECLAIEQEDIGEVNLDNLSPLKIKNSKDLLLTRNSINLEHQQVWFTIEDRSVKSNVHGDFAIGVIKYLNKELAFEALQEVFSSGELIISQSSNNDFEFCGYYTSRLVGMSENSTFIVLGIEGSYFMMYGKTSLLVKVFGVNTYCGITMP